MAVAEPPATDGATVPRIAVVDDDPLLRESLEQNLLDAGYRVTCYADGAAVLDDIAGGAVPDLLLLDWKMPEMNGIEVLKRLRGDSHTVPVIFLTVLTDQIYEEAALAGGAVDFIEKSRSFTILKRRIDLILSGARGTSTAAPGDGASSGNADDDTGEDRHTVGDLELRPRIRRAFWKGQELPFSVTEFDIVHRLAGAAGEDVPYREIYDLARGEGFVAGHGPEGYRANVRTHIKRIRAKFRDVDPTFDAIENYPGFGYRWRAGDG